MPGNHIVERAHSVGLERGDRIGRPPIGGLLLGTLKAFDVKVFRAFGEFAFIEESRIAKRHGSMSGSTPGYSRMIPSGRLSAENHR